MCGICGKLYFDSFKCVSDLEISRMNQTQVHRGPDEAGIKSDNNVGLGFRRLSIIDIKTGQQPLSNEDGSIWIIFNGEIYNYRELRRELKLKGHQFRTDSDTETIIHLYEDFGEYCVSHLRGMFAFSIWNSKTKKLFCARDRFGIKPFFYCLTADSFTWGSEIKSILVSEGFEKQIDVNVLNAYFTYGYTTDEKSIFKGIKKLLPGHCLTISSDLPGQSIQTQYWQPSFEPDFRKSEGEWIEEIQSSFQETVQMHMMSDVPFGAFLSGGIDSSSIVAMMAMNSTRPIKTFSIGFKEAAYNELQYARLIANKYHTEHNEHILEPESVGILSKLVHGYDEPFADSSAIPSYYLSKFAREHVTVAISGDGGDELFAGYDNYKRFSLINRYNILPAKINKFIFNIALNLLKDHVRGKKLFLYLQQKKELASVYSAIWHNYERKSLFNLQTKELINLNKPESDRGVKLNVILKNFDFMSSLQCQDMQSYLPDDILTKVDRASMLNSLEVRVPFLDHVFAELSFTIPSKLKYNHLGRKMIFIKAMEPYLEPDIITHKKQGFVAPLSQWFKNDLLEYVSDRLHRSNANIAQFFNMDYIESIMKIHHAGQRDFNSKLWSLLFFDAWFEHHFRS